MRTDIIEYLQKEVYHRCKQPTNKFGMGCYYHIEAVVKNAEILAEKYGADKETVIIAAWLHDIASITDYAMYALYEELELECNDNDVELVKKYVAAEYGEEFELVKLLSKGIAVHHSGLSDEVRVLIEWLMERGKLNILVATTTIAQGINFPVSTIIMAYTCFSFPALEHVRT